MITSQVMGRTLSSLKEDDAKLTSELEDKQNVLSTLTNDMAELKAKQERVALQVKLLGMRLPRLVSLPILHMSLHVHADNQAG